MADITWTITTTAGTVSHTETLTDPNIDRGVEYNHAWFPPLDAEGNILPRTTARDAQSFKDWADDQFEKYKTKVLDWEDQAAHQAVPPPDDLT